MFFPLVKEIDQLDVTATGKNVNRTEIFHQTVQMWFWEAADNCG
jgi:hypothetical protein